MSHVDVNEQSPTLVLIALGANVPGPAGPPKASLDAAIAALARLQLTGLVTSTYLRTPAYPPSDQPDFLNAVAAGSSALAPHALLARLHEIERGLGRMRDIPWAARPIDLDLLAVGETVSAGYWLAAARGDRPGEPEGPFILPHPRLHLRSFVIEPLWEIMPQWRHPALGMSAQAMLAKCKTGKS